MMVKRLVLFLGAGFSAQFGFPVMRTFFDFARDSGCVAGDDLTFLDELRRSARQANAIVQTSSTNLEDILSYAVMGERLGLPDVSGGSSQRLRAILHRVFGRRWPRQSGDYWKPFELFGQWVDGLGVGESTDLTIITTNYDLTVESSLFRAGNRARLGAGFFEKPAGGKQSTGNLYSTTNGVPLYKLHGSTSFFADPSEPTKLLFEGVVERVMSFGLSGSDQLPISMTGNYSTSDTPVLIPPTYLKPELADPLKTAWREAAESLRRAQTLVIVGYSFPQSDTEMKYFLGRSLAENVGLSKIVLIDPAANEIVAKLRRTETGFGNHFHELLHPVPRPWGADGVRLINLI